MCPDHSDHPALPQVIAVSCDNSKVSADTWEADPDRKNAVFQADWLSNRTHHTDNPIPVPTQNRARNYNEPAWVKQTWNRACRKDAFVKRRDWIYDNKVLNRWYKQGECQKFTKQFIGWVWYHNSNSSCNWSLIKLPNNYVYNTFYIWETDIRLLISRLKHVIYLYRVGRVGGRTEKPLETWVYLEHFSSWISFYSKFHRILHFKITTAAFKDLRRFVVISVFHLKSWRPYI